MSGRLLSPGGERLKRRTWLWIGGGTLAVLALFAVALLAPEPREVVEVELEHFATLNGLREIDPSSWSDGEQRESGLLTPEGEPVTPVQLFKSERSSIMEFERLTNRIALVLNRAGGNGSSYGSGYSSTNDVLTGAYSSTTLMFDWGAIDVNLVFSPSDDGKTTTWLAVWKSRRSLWDRVRDKFSPIAP